MAPLFEKLQIQGFYSDKLKQSLLIYRYKEFELLLGSMSLKAFLIPFSNQLPLGQGK